jgi:hypothetical protein
MYLKIVFSLLISFSLFFSVQLYAQEIESDTIKISEDIVKDAVPLQNSSDLVWKPCISPFIEFGGKGFLSVNVDFRKWESHAISVGFLIEGLTPNIMYYYLAGKRHRFEIGGGLSTGFSSDFRLAMISMHGVIGYRYQKKKGLFFRAGFTPFYVIFLNNNDRSNLFYPWVGLSLGYSF